MIEALIVFRRALNLWRRHVVVLTLVSLAWAALSLTIVLLPPATAGLYAVANRIAYGEPPRTEHFLAGARRYGMLSVRWALVNLAAGSLFYAGFSIAGLAGTGRTALILVLGGWIAVQFYTWPLLFEAPHKRLLPVLRTALLLALAAPLYTLTLLWVVALTILTVTAIADPLGLLAAGFVALTGCLAVTERLAAYGHTPDPRAACLD